MLDIWPISPVTRGGALKMRRFWYGASYGAKIVVSVDLPHPLQNAKPKVVNELRRLVGTENSATCASNV